MDALHLLLHFAKTLQKYVHDIASNVLTLCSLLLKQTIYEVTFVTGDQATFVHAAHEISHVTFYKSLVNR